LVSIALVVFFAVAWRVWQPYLCIYHSQQRIERLQQQLRQGRVEETELAYRLATAATREGAERVAARHGLGAPGTVVLSPQWREDDVAESERSLYQSTAGWAEQWLSRRVQRRLDTERRPLEPANRSLGLR